MPWLRKQSSYMKREVEKMVDAMVARGYGEWWAHQEIMGYVLGGWEGVSDEAQAAVRDAIEEVGFEA